MSQDSHEFQAWLDHVRAGAEGPARRLVEEFGPYLLRAVRARLNQKLRSKYDSRDFVQDVWASFFAHLPDHPFRTPAHLAAYLDALARNKVVDATRQRLQAEQYNVNREHSLNASGAKGRGEPAASQPTPSTLAMTREQWQLLLDRQPPVYRRILVLFHQGGTADQIAQELRISERTVRRVIDKAFLSLES